MNASELNRHGWRDIPALRGMVHGLPSLAGLLVKRNDKQGIALLKCNDGRLVQVHVDWFEKAKQERVAIAKPSRKARVAKVTHDLSEYV